MLNHPKLMHIGQVAVFYVPRMKRFECYHLGQSVHSAIHEFLIENFDAYTVENSGNADGYWRRNKNESLCHDMSARYEVSFAGKDKIPAFVDFLSAICRAMGEEAIYLTMGRNSYLVTPEGAE